MPARSPCLAPRLAVARSEVRPAAGTGRAGKPAETCVEARCLRSLHLHPGTSREGSGARAVPQASSSGGGPAPPPHRAQPPPATRTPAWTEPRRGRGAGAACDRKLVRMGCGRSSTKGRNRHEPLPQPPARWPGCLHVGSPSGPSSSPTRDVPDVPASRRQDTLFHPPRRHAGSTTGQIGRDGGGVTGTLQGL